MAAELSGPDDQPQAPLELAYLSDASISSWNSGTLFVEAGEHGIKYGTRHIFKLTDAQSVVAIEGLRQNPSLTVEKLVMQAPFREELFREQEQMRSANSPAGQERQMQLDRRDGGRLAPVYPMTELIAASNNDITNFIVIGNYHTVVKLAKVFCLEGNLPASLEDFVQQFVAEIMLKPGFINKFDQNRGQGSFVNYIAMRMKYFMRDLHREKPWQARTFISMTDSTSLFTDDPDERDLLDALAIPEYEAVTRQAQLILESEDPYVKRLADLCHSANMTRREQLVFILRYWKELSSPQIQPFLKAIGEEMTVHNIDVMIGRLRERIAEKGEEEVEAAIWRDITT